MSDFVNGLFEFMGGCFLLMNCWRLYRDKQLKGVSWLPTVIFTAWGWWNLFYYPSLHQWWSFDGGCMIVAANMLWLTMTVYYLNATMNAYYLNATSDIDRTGCFYDPSIETFLGKLFPVLNPHPNDIDIEVIAHSLSKLCRYNGHCLIHYTVAEHSYLVADLLRKQGYDPTIQLIGLLHDAAEAYTGDVIRPIKNIPDMEPYRKIQARVEDVIWEWANIEYTPEIKKIIQLADNMVLKAEAKVIMTSKGATWGLDAIPDSDIELKRLDCDQAKTLFLSLYNELNVQCIA